MKGTTTWHNRAAALMGWADCGKTGDAYYRAMTDWLTSKPTKGSANNVYDLAIIYEKALQDYLACINKLPVSSDAERDRTKGLAYQSYLAGDIKFLLPMCH